MVSGDDLILADTEILTALRHRNCLLFFTAVIAFLMIIGVRDEARNFLPWQNALFLGLLQVVAVTGIAATLATLRLLRKAEVVTVHMTPLVAMGAAMMVAASESMVALSGGPMLDSLFEYLILWFLFYTIGEIELVVLCTVIAPTVLHEIRNRPDLAAQPAPAPSAQGGGALVLGDLRLEPATIRHVRAEGNYVDIRTDTHRHYLLTTFATVLSALDGAQGRQVHRSHWVAERVVAGFFRDGRDIVVRLEDGTEIHVAQSRQKDVLPWLESVSVRLQGEDRAA